MDDVAIPGWATIPSSYSLADARLWHLFFAWIFALGLLFYGLWSFASRHLTRDLLPTRPELAPAHSAKTAPITATAIAIFVPLKKKGRAEGSSTRPRITAKRLLR